MWNKPFSLIVDGMSVDRVAFATKELSILQLLLRCKKRLYGHQIKKKSPSSPGPLNTFGDSFEPHSIL
jgi:hypothetical protein